MDNKLMFRKVTRRSFLAGVGAAAALPILAACQPQVVEKVVEKVVTQIVEKEKLVEKEKIVEKTVEKVVTQVVEKEKIVEKVTVVTPTPVPPVKIGPELMHPTMEGATIVVDVSQYPKAFKESPLFAGMVKEGRLPAIEKRLPVPEDILVVKPLNEIGKYGGTWRRGFTGPSDSPAAARWATHDSPLMWNYNMQSIIPNVAKGWELSKDGKTTTIFLRRGLKWSDGEPVTANDFIFWWEDLYNNKELTPSKPIDFFAQGKEGKMEKVDDFTVRYTFPEPYFTFPELLASVSGVSGPGTSFGNPGVAGGFAPAHYAKKYHAKYADKATLDKLMKDAGFENWVAFYKKMNTWWLTPGYPTVAPWLCVIPVNRSTWVWEPNPYWYQVDTAGNQLPYFSSLVNTLAESIEILNLRAIAGEYDVESRNTQLSKLPVFLQNQERGNYKVWLSPILYGAAPGMMLNHSYEKDPEIAKWIMNLDFRKALSAGIDRAQINETFFLGLGAIGSGIPGKDNPYYPGDEYKLKNHTFDVKLANDLLDKLGLDKKDADGFRLRTDGKGPLTIELPAFTPEAHLPIIGINQMIAQQWKKIGIRADLTTASTTVVATRLANNEFPIYFWENNSSELMLTNPNGLVPLSGGGYSASPLGPLTAKWIETNGKEGKPPPAGYSLQKGVDLFRKMAGVTAPERIPMGKDLWKLQVDELWIIGIVGLMPAVLSVNIVKNNVGNVPRRMAISSAGLTPANVRPETWYFKS